MFRLVKATYYSLTPELTTGSAGPEASGDWQKEGQAGTDERHDGQGESLHWDSEDPGEPLCGALKRPKLSFLSRKIPSGITSGLSDKAQLMNVL